MTGGDRAMFRRMFCGLLAILGALYCVLSALGFKALCVTAGCAVYAGATIFGLPIYWLGALAFAGAALVSLVPGLWRAAPALTALLLGGDVLFLLWQTVFLPCASCLAVAACLAGVFLLAAPRRRGWELALLAAWGLLAGVNAIDSAREQAGPWAMHGDPAMATIEVFFSMECPKCRQTLRDLLPDAAAEKRIALYPVAKNAADAADLARLNDRLRAGDGLRESLEAVWDQSAQPAPGQSAPAGSLALDLRLAWNKALLIRSGHRTVPVVLSSGPTGVTAPSRPPHADSTTGRKPAATPLQAPPAGDLPLFSPAPKTPAPGFDLGECKDGEEKGCGI